MIPQGNGRRVYIAGPMRGLPDLNFPAFYSAARAWRAAGWVVFNPAETTAALSYSPNEIADPEEARRKLVHVARVDIESVFQSHAVALLSGWEGSRLGAVELSLAMALGLLIFDAESGEPADPDPCPWREIKAFIRDWEPKRDAPPLP